MGYTHYFVQKKAVSDKQWGALCERVKQVFDLFEANSGANKVFICTADGKKIITRASDLIHHHPDYGPCIQFNGCAAQELDHESCVLYRDFEPNSAFLFCKTNHKPYDWFVVAVLILVHHYCADSYEVSSDGDTGDWQPVLDWLNQHLKSSFKIPYLVERPDVADLVA